MSVLKFFKKITEMISERIFLNTRVWLRLHSHTACDINFLINSHVTLAFGFGHDLRVVCFNTQLYRTARDRVLTNHVSQLVIRQNHLSTLRITV